MSKLSLLLLGTLFVFSAAAIDPFYSHLQPCPESCIGGPDEWSVYPSLQRLSNCKRPVLLDFAIHNDVNDSSTPVKFRTCAAEAMPKASNKKTVAGRSASCFSNNTENVVAMALDISKSLGHAPIQDIETALDAAETYLTMSCGAEFIVGRSGNAVVGVYSGPLIDSQATLPSLLQQLAMQARGSENTIIQLCGKGRTAENTLGIIVNTSGDLAAVQRAIVSWQGANCDGTAQETSQVKRFSVFEATQVSSMSGSSSYHIARKDLSATRLSARSDCTTKKVVPGDSCGSLATKCAIAADDFTKYNPQDNLCSSLTPGQQVCCSSGSLPDLKPVQNKNGSCASYNVQSGDTCASIAANNGLVVDDIGRFNNKTTWGWSGCNGLMAGMAICLSTGTPPMPASLPNAVCGPIKPGSVANASVALADMNPCPLNACCNTWGQCGITPEYCDGLLDPSANPGTNPAGKIGCISNCDTWIPFPQRQKPPQEFKTVAYYESWNWDRPCLNLRADNIDITQYSHLHWGFATVDSSFHVLVNDTFNQWHRFTSLGGINRIVSIGGWGFSTDPTTYNLLRKAMDPTNVDTFIDNVIMFVNDNDLDGVDFDWEYPGAPDIPGIPAGLHSDGPNYLAFLTKLRAKMPQGKTISIAAPASFWYLKAFPIADMSKQLDYIVYMTYDLHGQWDYGNAWSQDGCSTGNCLRSHVNRTETGYALAMITKAGVPTNMITVGLPSYGRSFGLTQPGCFNSTCTFGGPGSTATPGSCTNTAGYISEAEINQILIINDTTSKPQRWWDPKSATNILVYNDNQWVSYLEPEKKEQRTQDYVKSHFGGIVDWAVDLKEFGSDDGNPNYDEENDEPLTDPPVCDATYATLEDLDAVANSIDEDCKGIYLTQTLSNVLGAALKNYTDMMQNGYDDKFNTYAKSVVDSASSQVNKFVTDNGNKYFSCIVAETSTCCDDCKRNSQSDSYCDYCFTGSCYQTCNSETGCTDKRSNLDTALLSGSRLFERDVPHAERVPIQRIQNVSEPCPPDYSKRGQGPNNPYEQTVYWTLLDNQADAFYADLMTNTSIAKDKIKFDTVNRGLDCAPSAKPGDPCFASGMDYNIPVPNGYSISDVTNPKDVIQKALNNSNDLMTQVQSAITNMQLDCFGGDPLDLVDSISLPILMIAQAVDSMSQIETVADKIDEEKRKAMILAFIGAILFFIPIAGEVLGSVAELADIASVIAILGEVGNAAMDVYTMVDDPKNSLLAIFGLVLAPLALGNIANISKAAGLRRAMSDDDIAKLGSKLATRMGTIKKVTGTCRRTP